ncbi:MAG: lytic transglycosylase domain-containing protein [Clostridia bacterium]|nr:lytic transglycosylase domain-containing protein [Clostridia bacterium]MBQ2669168.1 lytic transglycosylase domain-containing protein [Clostridia bacterium]MBQ3472347.1 lytic transglycosylase domain-containing protein [Clostridia bacterium]MBQ6530418.1 lytic transglycosylase domain-containing protein [Clostridia bacterium]MBQ6558797.1 lytic transglycosylase domain-containing protein [Clostridia bacterium]
MLKTVLICVAIICGVVGIVVGTYEGVETAKRVKYPIAYGDYILRYAGENDLDPFLVMAVIHIESNFVPEAQSHVAYGLMQMTEETADWTARDMKIKGDYDFTDPETSIMLGCHYLRHLIDIYGNVDTALAAYNAGMGNINSWLKNPDCSKDGKTLYYIPFPETRSYVQKVNESWEYYKTTDFTDLNEEQGRLGQE